jgi:hypothetical protein
MALNTKKIPHQGGGDRVEQPELEAGVYPARVVQIIDFGLQPQRAYQGKEKSPAYEIQVTYELVDVFMVDEDGNEIEDKPRWISETFPIYSLEADMAKSTKRYNALDPDCVHDGDFSLLLDTPCNVTLVINKKGDKVYTNVASVGAMRPRDAAKCPELVNEAKFFDLDSPDLAVFNSLPKWIQEKITSNLEFKGSKLDVLLGDAPAQEEEKKEKPARKPRKQEAPVEDDEPAFDPDEDEDSPY